MKNKFKLLALVIILVPILLFTGCIDGETIDVGVVNTPNVIIPTPVPIIQSVSADPHNSSVANVNAGATFTGTSTNSLGIGAIQVSLATDQNCIVYVDQSPDGINWDVTHHQDYISSLGGAAWPFTAMQSYLRVRVTNIGLANTTYFRLQTALCPISETLPVSLSDKGRLITESTLSDDYGFGVENTPMGEQRVAEVYKLVGATFIGTTLDTNFWQTNLVNGGTVTQSGGELLVQTNTTANGAAYVSSVRKARYVAGSSMRYRAVIQDGVGLANNVRRWGVVDWATLPTITDGAYFIQNGTTLGVATMKGGAQTLVSSGSFNGTIGSSYVLDTNAHTFEIYWTNSSVWFVVDDSVLHKVSATTATWSETNTFYLWGDSVNSGGLTTNKTLQFRVMSIARLGALQTAPIYKTLTTAATYILKYGAGNLHTIIIGTQANQTITLYDNTSAAGTPFSIITLGNNTIPIDLPYNMDFYVGLTAVVSGTINATVVFE